MIVRERIIAYGHPNVRATHRSTIEFTKETGLSTRGDCILAVKANKSVKDLSESFKNVARRIDSIIIVFLRTNRKEDFVLAQGSPQLIFGDERRVILRKSTYIEPATLCIKANKAAVDIDRGLIKDLQNPQTVVYIDILAVPSEYLFSLGEEVYFDKSWLKGD